MVSTRSRTADVPPWCRLWKLATPAPPRRCRASWKLKPGCSRSSPNTRREMQTEEMEALREENSRLRRRIETDKVAGEPNLPHSRMEAPPQSRNDPPPYSKLDVHPTEDESEYRPTAPTLGGNYSSFASGRNRRHPFVDEITETPLPHKWKAPTVTYDGTTDTDEFVSIYTNQVSLYSIDDAVLCKSFSVALRGSALEWFMSRPPYTIDSFTTLTSTFTT